MSSSTSSAPVWSFDLTSDPLTLEGILRLRTEALQSAARRDQFRNIVESIPDTHESCERRGIGYWILGRNADALETLKPIKTPICDFVRAKSLLGCGETDAALEAFVSQKSDDKVGVAARFGEMECFVVRGSFDLLAKALKSVPKALAETADVHYFQGRLAEANGKYEQAIVQFEKAIEIHPEHRKAIFRLAYSLDLHGMDEDAVQIYERLVKLPPVDVAAVMNLGILYEDRGEYPRAIACFDAALRSDPTNMRARLYKSDCESALVMYYDETQERKDDKLQQTLRIPITDFELSVRARNCLTKMNIRTLGDLVRKSETELLSYKNFGETSLNEIKAILASKNLRLGMLPPERIVVPPPELGSVDPNLYSKPILELDLSVRSRRTMEALTIRTVGDLLQHSAEELLAMPNFGQTSLNEIRMKLRALGVDVRDSRSGGKIYTSAGGFGTPLPPLKSVYPEDELVEDVEDFDEEEIDEDLEDKDLEAEETDANDTDDAARDE